MKIRSLFVVLFALATSLISFGAHAQSATAKVETNCDGSTSEESCVIQWQRVTVSFFPAPADVGRPAAFYIGAGNGTGYTVWANGAWQSPVDGSGVRQYQAADWTPVLPNAQRDYIVFDNSLVCSMPGASGHLVDLYAGYGVLTPDAESKVQNYVSVAGSGPGRVPADHIRDTHVRENMQKTNKYWTVLKFDCQPPMN